jgi:hypothetical protein
MKFHNGQRVRIIDDIDELETIDLGSWFAGKIVTLEDCYDPGTHLHFRIAGGNEYNGRWFIEEWMVAPIEEQMLFQFNSGVINVRRKKGNGGRSKRGCKAKKL